MHSLSFSVTFYCDIGIAILQDLFIVYSYPITSARHGKIAIWWETIGVCIAPRPLTLMTDRGKKNERIKSKIQGMQDPLKKKSSWSYERVCKVFISYANSRLKNNSGIWPFGNILKGNGWINRKHKQVFSLPKIEAIITYPEQHFRIDI